MSRYEPEVEPVNGVVQPPFIPPHHRPGRVTNQLQVSCMNYWNNSTNCNDGILLVFKNCCDEEHVEA